MAINKKPIEAFIICILLACAVSCPRGNAAEAEGIDRSPVESYSFGLWLYQQRDLSRAITEFKRVIFESGSHSPEMTEASVFMIGSCYLAAQDFQRALKGYSDYLMTYPNGQYGVNAKYRIASCHFGLEHYVQTKELLDKLLVDYPDSEYVDDAEFLIAFSYFMSRRWQQAANYFGKFLQKYGDSPLRPGAKKLREAAIGLQSMDRKSKDRAVAFSAIIPGTGQMYAGRTEDGLMAFATTVGTLYYAADRFAEDDHKAGWLLGFIGASFYSGNIYGAVNAVEHRNERHERELASQAFESISKTLKQTLGHPDDVLIIPAAVQQDRPIAPIQ